MVEILHRGQPGKLLSAHKNKRCLDCHAPAVSGTGISGAEPLAPLGVGCESCHGPAEKYLTTHYQDEFKALTPKQKAERYGLFPTKDLAFRVAMCSPCHVGGNGKEVDHELIAAGHPRLAFEYTSYHRSPKYNRHWRETNYGSDFDARAWEIGEVASARAAAKLLSDRVHRATDRSWPELSEYSCFACHKDLSSPAWKSSTATDRKAGSLSWGTWYFSALDLAAGPNGAAEVATVRQLMERPISNRMAIVAAVNRLVNKLDARLQELQRAASAGSRDRPYDGKYLSVRFDSIVSHALDADRRHFRDLDWDGVTQHYLGAAAYYYSLRRARTDRDDLSTRRTLGRVRDLLSFPIGYNSPKNVDPVELIKLFRQLGSSTSDRAAHP